MYLQLPLSIPLLSRTNTVKDQSGGENGGIQAKKECERAVDVETETESE